MNTKRYKTCAVPMCKNTSITTPEKLFIQVPKIKQIRKKWLTLAKRDPKTLTPRSTSYFCEDHFDLPNDMENYVRYKIMNSVSLIQMKPGCLPSRFDCQPERLRRVPSHTFTRPLILRKRHTELINKAETSVQTVEGSNVSESINQINLDSSAIYESDVSAIEGSVPDQSNKSDKVIQVAMKKSNYRSQGMQTIDYMRDMSTSPIMEYTDDINTSLFDVKSETVEPIIIGHPPKLQFHESESDSDTLSCASPPHVASLQCTSFDIKALNKVNIEIKMKLFKHSIFVI